MDPSVDWMGAYLNDAVPFHHKSLIPFAGHFAKLGKAACLPLRLYEIDVETAARTAAAGDDLTVRQPDALERRRLLEVLRQRFGRCFCEAFDRTEETLDWSVNDAEWARVGLQRERALFVVTGPDQTLVAAAIAERATAGSNLFNIFDALTITQIAETASDAVLRRAQALLVSRASRWFLQHDVRRFITPVFAAETRLAAPLGATDLGSGALWVVERSLFGRLQEYFHLLF